MAIRNLPLHTWGALLTMWSCTPLPGKSHVFDPDGDGATWPADCENTDPNIGPDHEEVWYNGLDDDCNEYTRDDDQDGDGHAPTERGGTDCDDADEYSYPSAADAVGDGVDQSCDGIDGVDGDDDGYASEASGGTDCDDTNAQVSPSATEVCDNLDNDCDGDRDDADDSLDASNGETGYSDVDGDGFGNPNAPIRACTLPVNAVDNDDDCDDTSGSAFPGADEVCIDNVDQNCDGNDMELGGESCDSDVPCTQLTSCGTQADPGWCNCHCTDGGELVWEFRGKCSSLYSCPPSRSVFRFAQSANFTDWISCPDEASAQLPATSTSGTFRFEIQFDCGLRDEGSFVHWYNDYFNNRDDATAGAIIALNQNGTEIDRWSFFDAQIIALSANNVDLSNNSCTGLATATLEFGYLSH